MVHHHPISNFLSEGADKGYMGIKGALRQLTEKVTGTHIYRNIPRGVDMLHDLATLLPNFVARTVFDVGANVGQSALVYSERFPNARVYCFEPVTSTFRELSARVQALPNVTCHQVAFGASAREARMVLKGSSDCFYIADASKGALISDDPSENVVVATMNEFCREQRIDRISFLKIDTEGGDLDVLKGADRMLGDGNIDVVEVEAGMNPTNTRHVPFEALKQYLEGFGYYLFGIYEQVNEWPAKAPHLRRTNPVFISPQTIKNNCG